ncbi:TetR/AcrR family transcriptional regulator [Virgibacillus litoralis]|uniref:AcrR family transcriptional regulator n=1 Tax=Virgibacillus litoralis TaxID=578221 RepID=A0ABS4HEK3_9BACI|nr:TetR/AcrR family transcriptional regulator [Virgibacillus litoralis]MBP1949342.1 AcrR family transcriptional regulator [Virgibacillus litoralis]
MSNTKTKFQIRREETYENLIKFGIKPMMDKGFAKTNLSDIVGAAGYTRGAFYFHFNSKEEFFLHVLEDHDKRRGSWAGIPYHYHAQETSLESLLKESIFSLWQNVYEKPLTGWLLLVIDFYQNAKDIPDVKKRMKQLHENFEDDLILFLQALKKQGFIDAHIDEKKALWQLISLTYGYLVNYYIYDLDDIDIIVNAYAKILKN